MSKSVSTLTETLDNIQKSKTINDMTVLQS